MKIPAWLEGSRAKIAYAGYAAFYLVAFVVFLLIAFPYRVLRDRLVLDFARGERKSAHPRTLTIDAIGPAWGGVRATGLALTTPGEKQGDKPASLVVSELVVRPSIAAAAMGSVDVAFDAQVFGGRVTGRIVDSSRERAAVVKVAHVDLKQWGGATSALGLPIEGFVDASLRLELPEGKGAKASGAAQLEITEFAVGDGKAKFREQLAVPKLTVGTLVFSAEAKEGSLRIAKLGASGHDLDLIGEGRVKLNDFVSDSALECGMRGKICATKIVTGNAKKMPSGPA